MDPFTDPFTTQIHGGASGSGYFDENGVGADVMADPSFDADLP